MSNSDAYPRTETYYDKLERLAKITQFEKDQNGVLSLTKRDPKVKEGQEDPVLAEYQKEYKFPKDYQAAKSKAMQSAEREPRNDTEKKLFDWRARMNGVSKNMAPYVDTRLITTDEGITMKEYTPKLVDQSNPLPAVVYIHGGGFIGGSIYLTEDFSYLLSQVARVKVYAIDFRYAPEYDYETAISDNYTSLKYLYDHSSELGIDPKNITLYGESTGANITAAVIYTDRDTRYAKQQILFYPLVTIDSEQIRKMVPTGSGSGAVGASGDFTTLIDTIGTAYTHNKISKLDPLVSPINYSDDITKNLPRTLLVADEFDPLHEEDYDFAKKLSQAGVDLHYIYYPGMTHAFLNNVGLYAQAEDAAYEIAKWLSKAK
ncbi:alpha/beta hydrolase [Lentilactobacillus laojiaonis]|uniref:alpha/beta hydrolase n=1 Tax=Lentilactobacillus laojiaonis TaxID=2883998 RepID=UPI001D0BC541|nr:alpha/beta hydrolase [Lentilactobacillus laojiaonis]UDM32675.1 alpha/beta hydrolase [Lentilactobacillus laojiaonis]